MNTLIEANRNCLQQGMDFLRLIPADLYSKPCQGVFGSSIGGHFRHNLDHYQAFKDGFSKGRVDYDARERQPAIENEPGIAAEVSQQLLAFFDNIAGEDLDKTMQIRMDDGGDSAWSRTSLRRELQFLLSHTIHHYALVVSIAARFGYADFPDGFGIAPSTLHYKEKREA